MKKTTKKPLALDAQTVRSLRETSLDEAAGGYYSIPCGTRGCSIYSCYASCSPTNCPQ